MSNTQNKPTPHRHAELIKAWADGAKIQMFNFRDKKWEDSDTPTWLGDKYRIKPEEPSNESWKPKEDDKYFLLEVFEGEFRVKYYIWDDDEVDDALYRNHNCFRTKEEAEAAAERVKAALKETTDVSANVGCNVGGDKVMSREEADSAMRSAIGICAIIDRNTYLLRENNKLKEELESLIIRCEYLQKAKEQLISQQAVVDGKPLTDGEKALIRAFRNGRLCRQFSNGSSLIVEGHDKVPKGVTTHREFVAFFMHSTMQDGEVRNALEKIQAEQEAAQ